MAYDEGLEWLDRYEVATDPYEKMFHLHRAPELDSDGTRSAECGADAVGE